MTLLYLGNILAGHGKTPTSVETLGLKLSSVAMVVRFSNRKNQVLRLLEMLWGVMKWGRKADYALIDTYSGRAFYYALISALGLHILRVRYIPILHGGSLPKRLINSPRLCRFLFGNAFVNIAPSGYLRTHFEDAGFQVVEIPNYIEITNYPFLQRRVVRPYLLWVRSFHQIYRPEWAVLILEQLRLQHPDARLCMVGPDKDGSMEYCKTLVREKQLEPFVQFTGTLKKSDWIALSSTYDIFLNTTTVDNTPVSVMEAMALGIPVVTTSVGGIPWLFVNEEEGIMVPDADIPDMVDAITRLMENPEQAARISRQARLKAESWDWEKVRQRWAALLQKQNT